MHGDGEAGLRVLRGLVDDCGLFPSDARSAEEVVARYRANQAAAHPMLSHRLLCPLSRLDDVRGVLRPDDAVDLVLIVNEAMDAIGPAAAEIALDPSLDLVGIEFPMFATGAHDPAAALARILGGLEGARIPFEVSLAILPVHVRDTGPLAAAIAERDHARPVGVKLWCGTDLAGRYPVASDLATALCSTARVGGETRAAAGLNHTAVRTADDDGVTPHGFLNLLLAAALAATGEESPDVTDILRCTDPEEIVDGLRRLDDTQADACRRLLTTFGAAHPHTPITLAHETGLLPASDNIPG